MEITINNTLKYKLNEKIDYYEEKNSFIILKSLKTVLFLISLSKNRNAIKGNNARY